MTLKRPRPVTKSPQDAAFARRVLRACSRRVATGDVEPLAHMIGLADDIIDVIAKAAYRLRAAGASLAWMTAGGVAGLADPGTFARSRECRWGLSCRA